jgi:uncharacterized protein YggE
MAVKQRERAGVILPARSETRTETTVKEDTDMSTTTTQAAEMSHTRVRPDGITVIGEAVRRTAPDQAEFLMEITATASTAAQALRDNQAKTAQITQTLGALGVQQTDIQTISMNVYNVYSPVTQALPPYAMPQLNAGFGTGFGPGVNGGMTPFATGIQTGMQTDVQFGSCQARCALRINVRDAARVGEVLDTMARAGASVSPFCFKALDEAAARRSALEAAGKDARAKAEVLAGAAGRKLGEATAIAEEIVASNGAYAALRSAFPFSFGAGAPQVAGELEYYARVSASFRFQ